jgi:peptidoglycan hydrolase CwlO-like protein
MLNGLLWDIILNFDFKSIIEQLENAPHVFVIAIGIAEKLYRLHKLNKLDREQQALKEAVAQALADIAKLSARVEKGDSKVIELKTLVAQHEQTITKLKAGAKPIQTDV